MEARFHRRVQSDVDEVLRRYDGVSQRLGEDSFAEFQIGIRKAMANPQYFHFDRSGLRRCNLDRVIAKLLKVVAVLLVLGDFGYFALPRLVCTDVPKRQKLADCDTNTLAFTMTCDHSPPYQIVLGLGPSQTGRLAFHG